MNAILELWFTLKITSWNQSTKTCFFSDYVLTMSAVIYIDQFLGKDAYICYGKSAQSGKIAQSDPNYRFIKVKT